MADAAELISLIEPLARQFFGEPNRAQSKKGELRFGTHGSLSVDLKLGTWYDFETQEGGGVLDLIKHVKKFTTDRECLEWLERDGYINGRGGRANGGNGQHGHSHARAQTGKQAPLGQEVAWYPYQDEAENVLFEVVRFDPKDFRQRVRDKTAPGGYRWSVKGVRQVPYRLPALRRIEQDIPQIVLAEGEKDVDRLWALGVPASCNAGGAGKWRSELNQYFDGADVIIIADNDPQTKDKAGELAKHPDGRPKFTGFDHAHAIAAQLIDVAERVRVLDLGRHWTDCPEKGDISDWLDAGGTVEQLHELFEKIPDWEPAFAHREPLIEHKRATAYVAPKEHEIPPRGWLHAGHYIRQAATATVAPGGFGKTTLTIHEAVEMVVAGLKVWYLSGEDPKDEIDRRIAAHCKRHKIDLNNTNGQLFVDDQSSFPMQIATAPRMGSVKFNDASLEQFEWAINEDEIDVVMLDPFISFHVVAENDNSSIDAVVKKLGKIAQRSGGPGSKDNNGSPEKGHGDGCCIEISHHVRKPFIGQGTLTVDDARGGSALINAVRSGRVINRMNATEAEAFNAARNADNQTFVCNNCGKVYTRLQDTCEACRQCDTVVEAQPEIRADDRHSYVRVDKGKRNMAPPDKATWFRLVNQPLLNGDDVQALVRFEFPKPVRPVEEDKTWLRIHMGEHPRLAVDRRTTEWPWINLVLAGHFDRDLDDEADEKWIKDAIKFFVKEKVIHKVQRTNSKSKLLSCYELVGGSGQPPRPMRLVVDNDDNGNGNSDNNDDDIV